MSYPIPSVEPSDPKRPDDECLENEEVEEKIPLSQAIEIVFNGVAEEDISLTDFLNEYIIY